jgi:WD40 repeat protein
MGPNSPEDRLLVAYGAQLVASADYDAVAVASTDQGIRVAISELRTTTRLPIFFIDNDPKGRGRQLNLLRSHVEFGLSSGALHPKCLFEVATPKVQGQVVFSPDARSFASVDTDGGAVHWWNKSTAAGGPIGSVRTQSRWEEGQQKLKDFQFTQFMFAPDGKSLLGMSELSSFQFDEQYLSELPSQQYLSMHVRRSSLASWLDSMPAEDHAYLIKSIYSLPLSDVAAAIGLVPSTPLRLAAKQDNFQCPTLSPDGHFLAIGIRQPRALALIAVLSVAESHLQACVSIPNKSESSTGDGVSALSFSPRNDMVAIGTIAGRVIVWSMKTGSIMPCDIHRNRISSLAFSADSQMLAFSVENASPHVGLLRAPEFAEATMLPVFAALACRRQAGTPASGQCGRRKTPCRFGCK